MFHAGHVAILKQAREFGDYLIAGVHSDEVVNAQRGLNMPIMNLNERVLSVLGCAYVNDVLIDAPLRITRFVFEFQMVQSLKANWDCTKSHGSGSQQTCDDDLTSSSLHLFFCDGQACWNEVKVTKCTYDGFALIFQGDDCVTQYLRCSAWDRGRQHGSARKGR